MEDDIENKFEIEPEEKKNEIKISNEIGEPPLVIVVQGGKKAGKTTLIRSLVKYYTNQNINEAKGSITIRNAKNQRLTFYECSNDISAMIDLSKIADIALVMIDATVGFEMETFEFISLLKNHGFTSIMGVLTHMDEFRRNKSLNKFKKQIKKRFLKDATDKAKLFYLFGVKNSLYLKLQMHTMARYLRVVKPNIPGFRMNHPYILSDRFEVTFINATSNDPADDVMVSFFGYVRGNHFNKNSTLHINGLGDFASSYVAKMDDPCPIEVVEVNGKKKRTLKNKDKFLYAPYCNINSLEYDRKTGYISIPEKYVTFTKGIKEGDEIVNNEGVRMVRELQDVHLKKKQIDEQIKEGKDIEILEGIDIDQTEKGQKVKAMTPSKDDYSSNYEMKNKALFYEETITSTLEKEIYSVNFHNANENDLIDSYKYVNAPMHTFDYLIKNAKKKFVTGGFSFQGQNDNITDDEEEENEQKAHKKNKVEETPPEEENIDEEEMKKRAEEKIQKVNSELKPFLNEEFGLFEKGSYVRIDIRTIKQKYIQHFKIEFPIILACTNIQESSFGLLKIRFLKHLWYPKILKNNDPLILSIGWRKFQTTPIFCIEDKNHRLRTIKYSPKYTSCFAIAYGPKLPINASVVAIQNFDQDVQHFRICATGDLIEINQSFQVMKKLKLIGEAFEIFKKTAYIKGMFNSNLEVARYIGAKIRTVSGIRGQIKKHLNVQPEGSFRATFEDKILKSDIVFLKTWTTIQPNYFYNPIIDYGNTKLLRTMYQLRKDFNLELPVNKDSEYTEINREERVFPSLVISKALEKSLPFKSKNKTNSQFLGKSSNYEEDDTFLLKKLNLPYKKPIKNYLTEKEKSIYSMLQRLQTIKNLKEKKLKKGGVEYEKKKKIEEDKQETLKKKRMREKIIKSIKKKMNKE